MGDSNAKPNKNWNICKLIASSKESICRALWNILDEVILHSLLSLQWIHSGIWVSLILPTHVKQKKVTLWQEILSSMPFNRKTGTVRTHSPWACAHSVGNKKWISRELKSIHLVSAQLLTFHSKTQLRRERGPTTCPIIRKKKNHYFSLGVLAIYRWVKMLEHFSFSLY